MKYKHKTEIEKLNAKMTEMQQHLDAFSSDVDQYKEQIKTLERQGTRKALFSEREQWKKLVETLRKDKKRLKEERDELRSLIDDKRNTGGEDSREYGEDDVTEPESTPNEVTEYRITKVHSPSDKKRRSRTSSVLGVLDDAERIKLEGEINILKSELNQKNVELEALKEKLDLELELKWERSQNLDNGWRKSLLDSFKEVLSPLPHSLRSEKDIVIEVDSSQT